MLKQSLIFIKGYLCTKQVEDNGVFRELFFQLVGLYALPGVGLVRIIEQIREHVTKALTGEHTDIRRQALADLVSMFEEMASVCAISPFIGDNGLDLRGHRLISFNLNGFGDDDKNVLVGLINLLIHQVFILKQHVICKALLFNVLACSCFMYAAGLFINSILLMTIQISPNRARRSHPKSYNGFPLVRILATRLLVDDRHQRNLATPATR